MRVQNVTTNRLLGPVTFDPDRLAEGAQTLDGLVERQHRGGRGQRLGSERLDADLLQTSRRGTSKLARGIRDPHDPQRYGERPIG